MTNMVLYPRYEAISMEISRCLTPIISSNNEVNILHNVMLMWLHRPSVLRTHISRVPVMPVISILQKPNLFNKSQCARNYKPNSYQKSCPGPLEPDHDAPADFGPN